MNNLKEQYFIDDLLNPDLYSILYRDLMRFRPNLNIEKIIRQKNSMNINIFEM